MDDSTPASAGAAALDDADYVRGLELVIDGRDDEALDSFELAYESSDDPRVRRAAVAQLTRVLLTRDRPHEANVWLTTLRDLDGDESDLARIFDAAIRIRTGDPQGALDSLAGLEDPHDRDVTFAGAMVDIVRGRALLDLDRPDEAVAAVMAAVRTDPVLPDVWPSLGELASIEGLAVDLDAAVALIPDDRLVSVLGWLDTSYAGGAAEIMEALWRRLPGDTRLLAAAARGAWRFDLLYALEWSARLRDVGLVDACPLMTIATDTRISPDARVQAAAIAHATFGDERAPEAIERAAAALPLDHLVPVLDSVAELDPEMLDAFVSGAAAGCRRSLLIARGLHELGASEAALAIAAQGLALAESEGEDMHAVLVETLDPATCGVLADIADAAEASDVATFLRHAHDDD